MIENGPNITSFSNIPTLLSTSFIEEVISPENAQDEKQLASSLDLLIHIEQTRGEELCIVLQQSTSFWENYTAIMIHYLKSSKLISLWLTSVRFLCRRGANKRTENPWLVQKLGDIGVCERIISLLHSHINNLSIVAEIH